MRIIGIMIITAVLAAGFVFADDTEELIDLQARLATLEAKRMASSAEGDAESLTSYRKNGSIRIGGEVEIGVSRRSVDKTSENASAAAQSGYASVISACTMGIDETFCPSLDFW